MNNCKEQLGYDMCKNHSARTEKDLYRVCPSKLSKKELEDMYFVLIESNIELKKTVNSQRDQIKLLNTKVHRLTAQRPNVREQKECCINNRTIINEQKDVIADLKKSNDRLTERIRLLNMRLCSAKQFLNKGAIGNIRCSKCNGGVSVINSSTSAFNIKADDVDSVKSVPVSYQNSNEPAKLNSPVPTSTREKQDGALCDQNKCRTIMDELKQKTVTLQQELTQTHEEYSSRIHRLEEEMSRLQKENVRVRSESNCSEQCLEQQREEISGLLKKLRKCEATCEHLSVQLKIEKSKTAELEMRAKATDSSHDIAIAIEKHFAAINAKNDSEEKRIEKESSAHSIGDPETGSMYHCQFQLIVPNNSISSSQNDKTSEISSEKINRASDDSGYNDTRSSGSCETSPQKNEVMNKIANLQSQLDNLKKSIGEKYDDDDNELWKSLQYRRKSCLERQVPSTSKDIEELNRLAPVPGDADYLIRTNRLNSKNPNEWCSEYDKSEGSSSIVENPQSSTVTGTDKTRRSSKHDKQTDEKYMQKDIGQFIEDKQGDTDKIGRDSKYYKEDKQTDEKYMQDIDSGKFIEDTQSDIDSVNAIIPKLDLSDIQESEEINRTYRKSSSLDDIQGSDKVNDEKPNEDFKFTKETITKVDGKLIADTIYVEQKSASTLDIKDSLQKLMNESNTDLTSISKIMKKNAATSVDFESKIDRQTEKLDLVSTGVDPIYFPSTPVKEVRDRVINEDTNPLPLLEKHRLDICENSVRVCTCPVSSRRGVSVFRSCSGTLRFTTTSNSNFRRCACGNENSNIQENNDVLNARTHNVRTSTPRGTYVLRGEATLDSPDNTRGEISSLSDLPSEREVSSSATSPGEHKGTCTRSDTPLSTTDYGSLSEGELTARRRQSIGETQVPEKDSLDRELTAEKMEETLREISKELSRCRHLLQVHNARETTRTASEDACCMTERLPFDTTLRSNELKEYSRKNDHSNNNTNEYSTHENSNKNDSIKRIDHNSLDRNNTHDSKNEYSAKENSSWKRNNAHERNSTRESRNDGTIESSWKQHRLYENNTNECNRKHDGSRNDRIDVHERCNEHNIIHESNTSQNRNSKEVKDNSSWNSVNERNNSNKRESRNDRTIESNCWKHNKLYENNIAKECNRDDRSRNDRNDIHERNPNERYISNESNSSHNRNSKDRRENSSWNSANERNSVRESGHALRKCDANQCVGGASAKCVFTLHVGTVILSDQALISSRSKSLALTWRFYDQSPTMTHQLAGRVMHYDFSLEYDIRITQNFLDYLKHEEMPIIVCEIDKQESPFASCSLPLRDALLHANRRVDMSLALVAGSGMKKDTLSTFSEEIGVLDVWCMLRVPPNMMSVINDVISQTIASFHHLASSLERIVDDDHSGYHLDQDLYMRRTGKPQPDKYSCDSENIYDIMNTKKWRRASALKQTDTRKKSVTILQKAARRSTSTQPAVAVKLSDDSNTLDITILWLALNEECRAMSNPRVKRLYVAYTFLGKNGADMETPSSLPKPKNFMDKCHFNFRKSFVINECDIAVVAQMARRRQDNTISTDPKNCVVFAVVSEPPEDPLGLESCEDIGYAYLYLGDALLSSGSSHTEVLPIRNPDDALVCGRLAVRVDGLPVLRACVERSNS